MDLLDTIKKTWENNDFVLIYDADDREAEVDFVIPSSKVKPKHIAMMRDFGGGLICCAIPYQVADIIELPYLYELYDAVSSEYKAIKLMASHELPYGAKSAFSVSINHVDCFTGITDWERALTVNNVAKLVNSFNKGSLDNTQITNEFGQNFRIPGHVPLLIARDQLLKKRQGHTELGIALCQMLGFPESTTICEMMSSRTNKAITVSEANKFSEKYGYPLIQGSSIIKLWKERFY